MGIFRDFFKHTFGAQIEEQKPVPIESRKELNMLTLLDLTINGSVVEVVLMSTSVDPGGNERGIATQRMADGTVTTCDYVMRKPAMPTAFNVFARPAE